MRSDHRRTDSDLRNVEWGRDDLLEESHLTCHVRSAVHEDRPEHAEDVRPWAVADGFDVGVVLGDGSTT